MSFVGTFGMFTTVRLGIYTSQKGLNLTGNNIANINTVGYTRQTLDIKSMSANGVDRYSDSNVRIGSGAYAYGVSQLRDPYLDIRYRTECASVGYMDTKLSNLNDLAAILDETGAGDDQNGVIAAQLSDFAAALQNLSEYTGQGEFDTQARSSATALVHLFNSYANKLDEVETNAVNLFESDLKIVNEILTNIRDLNTHIRTCDIHNSPALEMRDERNRLIDELAQYIKIDVEYTNEHIGPAVDVEKLSIKIAGTYPGQYLIDGIYSTTLEQSDLNPAYDPQIPGSLPYLDKDGNPTDVSNFDLMMTALTDNKGNIKTDFIKSTKEKPNPRIDTFTPADFTEDAGIKETIEELIGSSIDDDPELIAKLTAMYEGTLNKIEWNSTMTEDGYQTQYQLRKIVNETDSGTEISFMLTATNVKLSTDIQLGDNALYGSLQAAREFLTESGEFATIDYINTVDSSAATKRGVRYYKQALDLLARKFADSMNAANSGYRYTFDHDAQKYYYVDTEGKPITGPDGNLMEKKAEEDLTEDEIAYLNEHGSRPANYGNLFSVRGDSNDGEGITAANISISAGWASGDVQIVNSYAVVSGSNTIPSTDNTNVLHMVHLMDEDMNYNPTQLVDGTKDAAFFTGSFSEMLGNINAVLGNDQSSTQIMLDNYYTSAVDLDTGRDSVSSVDLNDETVNMIQYQKSYSAACRLMTALDETLDKLINGTGVAGR